MGTLQIELDNPDNQDRLQYVKSTLDFEREEQFDDVSLHYCILLCDVFMILFYT